MGYFTQFQVVQKSIHSLEEENGCDTNIGEIVSEPSSDGFVLMNMGESSPTPVLILGKRKNLSLYNNTFCI